MTTTGARWAIAILLLGGLLVRLPHLGDPPLDFHATRQYRSAVMARGYYLGHMTGLTPDMRQAAQASAASMGPIEPPIIEHLAAATYRLAGREDLRIARLISVLAWLAGGLALGWLALQLLGPAAAIAAVALMMFLPYGIPASQAFQPDALMTALGVLAVATAVCHDARPGARTLLYLTIAAAAALFVKPMAVFFFAPAVFVLAVRRKGWLRGLRFAVIWIVPVSVAAVAYYLAVVPASTLSGRLLPQLIHTTAFWTGWLRMLERVVWLPVVVAGLAGAALAHGRARAVLLSLWAGYVGFGLLFTYHIHTHDYYSLPVLPVVALSVGALVDAIGRRTAHAVWRRRIGAAGVVTLVCGVSVAVYAAHLFRSSADLNAEAARYARIGEDVHHSVRVLSLDGSYAISLNYHGFLAASNLPLSIDRAAQALRGEPTTAAATAATLAGADFFVATAQAELDAQPDLRAVLRERYPLIDRDGTADHWHYVVYDLRTWRVSTNPERVSVFALVNGTKISDTPVALWSANGAAWRVAVPEPALFDVEPAQGSGPATLHFRPRAGVAETDRTIDVPIYRGDGTTLSTTLTVRFKSFGADRRSSPFGFVDLPAEPVAMGSNTVTFQGWALDEFDLRRVSVVYVNAAGQLISLGEATRGAGRPDVAKAYPNAYDIYNPAWVFTLTPSAIAGEPRPLVLHFYAENGDGFRKEIGRRTITKK